MNPYIAEYIIVMTDRERVGELLGHDVYRATEYDLLPLDTRVSPQNAMHPVEDHLLALVKYHFQSGHFLCSYSWDLSRRLQSQWSTQVHDQTRFMWEVVRS